MIDMFDLMGLLINSMRNDNFSAFHNGNITFCRKEIDGVYNKKLSQFGSKFAIEIHVADQEVDSDRAYLPAELDSESSGMGRMTAGMPPSLRFIRLQTAFESLMERLCPTIAIYTQGKMIYDPDEVESRVLLYVVSGNAEVVFNSKNGGPDIKPARILIGKGDCFGERNFLLGGEREDSATFLLKAIENRPQTNDWSSTSCLHAGSEGDKSCPSGHCCLC
jgi:hypothetical protein